jgi:Flp pilus assembly pilin Flp
MHTRRGATASEYGLLAALIAVALIGSVATVGAEMRLTFFQASMGVDMEGTMLLGFDEYKANGGDPDLIELAEFEEMHNDTCVALPIGCQNPASLEAMFDAHHGGDEALDQTEFGEMVADIVNG